MAIQLFHDSPKNHPFQKKTPPIYIDTTSLSLSLFSRGDADLYIGGSKNCGRARGEGGARAEGETPLACPVGAPEPPVRPWRPRGLPRDRPGVQNSPTGLWEPKKHSAPRAAKKKWKKKWRAETTGSNPGNAPGARDRGPRARAQEPGRPPHRRDTFPENARPGGTPRETRDPEPEPISMLEERAGPGDIPGRSEAATRRLGAHVNGEHGETLCIHTGKLTPGEGKSMGVRPGAPANAPT